MKIIYFIWIETRELNTYNYINIKKANSIIELAFYFKKKIFISYDV